ncbi:hypothetical protein QM191_24985 [Serratia marcescens]|uniref:hypothetical protein n=1 Tax=Serratia marcescens TaxID=615 RepID=UPI0029492FA1|nr:hypothetical protein [Serratia marcescens]MDV5787373.1 hypothetical protein [Serratia marcescens]
MSTELNQPAITARIIPNNRRMAFLPRLFGAWYLTGEAGVYNHARSLCADYQGGSWEFVERHCCKVSDEAAFCLIQRPYISKTLLTRRISPRGSP